MRMDIWDTGGQERFKNISINYYKDVYTVIFVFDVNIKKITEKIKIRLDDANENMAKNTVKVLI
jgi:GTPase SAR1 family protein